MKRLLVLAVVALLLVRHTSPLPMRAAQAQDTLGTFAVNLTTGDSVQLGGPDAQVTWSPDGTLDAVAERGEFGDGSGGFALVNPDTGDVTQLLTAADGAVTNVAWSPDSTTLAFLFAPRRGRTLDQPALYTMQLGGEMTRLAAGVLELAWTPDSAGLTVSTLVTDGGLSFSIRTLDPSTGATRSIILPPTADICPYGPVWSPDGRYLAFASGAPFQGCGATEKTGLWVWDTGAQALQQLDNRFFYQAPQWTPAGIVFQVTTGTARSTVILAQPDGSGTQVLADGITVPGFPERVLGGGIVQARGGGLLVPRYACGRDGTITDAAVGVIEPNGNVRRLSNPTTLAFSPQLSPEGTRAAWVAVQDEKEALVLMPLAPGPRGSARPLPANSRLLNWSPDGGRLAYTVSDLLTRTCGG